MASDQSGGPSCPVCLHALAASGAHVPIDLGCGHVACDHCLAARPDAFLRCPECRAPSHNPHVSYALVRVLPPAPRQAAGGRGQGEGAHPGLAALQRALRGASRRVGHEQPPAAPAVTLLETFMGTGRASTSSPSSWWPSGAAQWVPTLWGGRSTPGPSQHPESLSAHGASALGLRARGGNAEHVAAALASELPHALHTVRTSFWSYLAPVVAFLYVISPLDLVPDVLPLIGWLDDLLVLVAVAWFLMSQLSQRQHGASAQQAHRPAGPAARRPPTSAR